MIIERGTKEHCQEAIELVRNFHKEALSEYVLKIDEANLIKFFDKCVAQSFFLIIDGKCEGIIAGQEIINPVSGEKIFQETIWYVNKPYRRDGVYLFYKAQEILKQEGYAAMVMICLANSKTEKLIRLYERMGFAPIEYHFIKRL